MTKKFHITLIWCLAVLAIFSVRAEDSNSNLAEMASAMRAWHSAQGLPSDSVTAIIQTHDGFLWIGTSAGLVRFDGVNFTPVKLSAASKDTVGVTALCEDEDGHLWIGTQADGLFELADGRIQNFSVAQGLLDNNVTSLAADFHENLWIGTKSGLNLWTGKNFKSFTIQDGLSDNFISGVHVARSGAVWITTRNGMCRFINGHIAPYAFQTESQGRSPEYLGAYEDRRGNLWAFGDTYLINLAEGKRFNYFRSSESASVRIWSLCEGHDGRLWIGTSGRGLFCFEDNNFQPVILGENRWPFDVRVICEDREGNLWLGTSGGGLLQLRPQSIHILHSEQGLPDSTSPTALALDSGGRVYAGFQRGGLFVGEAGRFDHADPASGLNLQNFITSVCVAPDDTLWAGTLGNGLYGLKNDRSLRLGTANGLADNHIIAVCVDGESNVWASTRFATLHRFSGSTETTFTAAQGLPEMPVTAMISSATGGLWLGTQNGQVLREKNGKFSVPAALKNLIHPSVLALHEDGQGQLWVGTDGGGLYCLTKGLALAWNISSGLPNETIAGIVEDRAKNLWLATGNGVYRVNHLNVLRSLNDQRNPLVCEFISAAKTAPDSGTIIGGPRALLAPDGQLWFATSEGLLNVDTHSSRAPALNTPLFLENVSFNNQPPISLLHGGGWSAVNTNSSPVIAPEDLRSLEFNFTALNFTAPDEVHFRHKLEGSDADWVDDGSQRFTRYTQRLAYGDYRFRVAILGADGAWQESPQTFSFVVPTPFYFQKWAVSLYVIFLLVFIGAIIRAVSHRRVRVALARLEQQQSLERERMRIARDMHDEMGSKLTKISFLSERAQVEAEPSGPLAVKIESIAQTSRELLKTMDEIVWVVNPHNDTLENLVAYLSHYAVEYFQNTSIDCELRLPPEIPHHGLSSEMRHNLFLTFEEALNNVLKHSKAASVKIEMSVKPREFEMKISDNGCGFAVPDLSELNTPARRGPGGNGLKNMRQRLVSVGGDCLIKSHRGQGTTVIMRTRLN